MKSNLQDKPFLSVVIPTYNRKDSLKITLDGLARQNYPITDFEVIVVSDGSTDGTSGFLEAYAKTAPYKLVSIPQDNNGPARARNHGVQLATGEIIVFLDDDVDPAAGFLTAHTRHHRENERIVIIGPMSRDPARRYQEPPWITWEHSMLEKQYSKFRAGEWKVTAHNFYSGNASLRRRYLLEVGGFDEDFKRQEDVELAHRLHRQCGLKFQFEPDAGGLHRPVRTFQSWLNIPYAYGQLDVVRARRGDANWKVVTDSYHSRNLITRKLADLVLARPALQPLMQTWLVAGARLAAKLHRDDLAHNAFSVLYNVHYLEGAQSELGSHQEMVQLLTSPSFPKKG